jgi:hypothetical protein
VADEDKKIICRLVGHDLFDTTRPAPVCPTNPASAPEVEEILVCRRCGVIDPPILVGYLPALVGGAFLTALFVILVVVPIALCGGFQTR